jgi:hypothetical protein
MGREPESGIRRLEYRDGFDQVEGDRRLPVGLRQPGRSDAAA